MKKILIFGSAGQVGWELSRSLAFAGQIIALKKMSADLTKSDKLRAVIQSITPDIIINAAAYTAVDKAESEPDCAMMVNGVAPGIIAEEAKRCGAIFVHYSTDYVFDGCSERPYCEDDRTNPINEYGKTKLAGEIAVQAVRGRHLIFRTSWVYGMRGRNFLLTMLKLAKEKEQLKIVMDQHGAPTWSRTIAEATREIICKGQAELDGKWGIYNLTTSGNTSWFGFAAAIFALKHKHEGKDFRCPHLIGIPTSEFSSPAKRPQYSVLSHYKIRDAFSLDLPGWEIALEDAMGYSD